MSKIVLNSKGIRDLLKSHEVKECITEEAEKIKGRCGNGYATDTKYMSTRVISSVFTETEDALQDNYDHNSLLKAMNG